LSERFKQTCQYKVVGTLDSLYKQQTERFCLSCPSQHP
jgi:hypothetical protein